jgi:hypothetical protein
MGGGGHSCPRQGCATVSARPSAPPPPLLPAPRGALTCTSATACRTVKARERAICRTCCSAASPSPSSPRLRRVASSAANSSSATPACPIWPINSRTAVITSPSMSTPSDVSTISVSTLLASASAGNSPGVESGIAATSAPLSRPPREEVPSPSRTRRPGALVWLSAASTAPGVVAELDGTLTGRPAPPPAAAAAPGTEATEPMRVAAPSRNDDVTGAAPAPPLPLPPLVLVCAAPPAPPSPSSVNNARSSAVSALDLRVDGAHRGQRGGGGCTGGVRARVGNKVELKAHLARGGIVSTSVGVGPEAALSAPLLALGTRWHCQHLCWRWARGGIVSTSAGVGHEVALSAPLLALGTRWH